MTIEITVRARVLAAKKTRNNRVKIIPISHKPIEVLIENYTIEVLIENYTNEIKNLFYNQCK